MKKQIKYRRLIVTLAMILATIVSSIVLSLTYQVASWVAQIVVALAFGYICFLTGWGAAKNHWGWKV